MSDPVTKSVTINTPVHLFDHRLIDQAVLPAVYAMSFLANIVRKEFKDIDLRSISKARFLRFLQMEEPGSSIEAQVEMKQTENCVTAALYMTAIAGKSKIRRRKDHVELSFGPDSKLQPPPIDTACNVEDSCYCLPPGPLYESMVPFGQAFQNVTGKVLLSRNGAVATVKAGQIDAGFSLPFGAPLALDAAFHVACAWGQRFAGFVGFPIGFKRRKVFQPAEKDQLYYCRLFPIGKKKDSLFFDLWLFDKEGNPVDAVAELEMADVSKGRMTAPDWIITGPNDQVLPTFKNHCLDFSLIEIESILPFAHTAFSKREADRFTQLGSRRKVSYAASRIALKNLGRKLFDGENKIHSSKIETLAEDSEHPTCVVPGQSEKIFATTSHNDRFVIAVASKRPIGVDVEKPRERMIRGMRLYMDDSEKALVKDSSLGEQQAAARIWTTKEAAAKALDLPLASARSRVLVRRIRTSETRVEIAGVLVSAYHEAIDDHLFTIIQLDVKS